MREGDTNLGLWLTHGRRRDCGRLSQLYAAFVVCCKAPQDVCRAALFFGGGMRRKQHKDLCWGQRREKSITAWERRLEDLGGRSGLHWSAAGQHWRDETLNEKGKKNGAEKLVVHVAAKLFFFFFSFEMSTYYFYLFFGGEYGIKKVKRWIFTLILTQRAGKQFNETSGKANMFQVNAWHLHFYTFIYW